MIRQENRPQAGSARKNVDDEPVSGNRFQPGVADEHYSPAPTKLFGVRANFLLQRLAPWPSMIHFKLRMISIAVMYLSKDNHSKTRVFSAKHNLVIGIPHNQIIDKHERNLLVQAHLRPDTPL
jgi:hypothetical protein